MRMAYMRQWRPAISRMVFTSPPSIRMACKLLAKFGDIFKEGLHKPTFHEDGLHAPMEAGNFKDGLHRGWLTSSGQFGLILGCRGEYPSAGLAGRGEVQKSAAPPAPAACKTHGCRGAYPSAGLAG